MFVTILISTVLAIQDPQDKDVEFYDETQLKLWEEYYASTAKEITVELGEDGKVTPKCSKPLMFWKNPASKRGTHGAVFAWTDDGYPVGLGALWSVVSGENRYVAFESHALVDNPMQWSGVGNLDWSPSSACDQGIEVPNLGGDIADSAEMREGEMDSLISRLKVFSARDDHDETIELRLENKRIWRYESKKYGVIDGGVFVAYYNNDPDLFILLEARQINDEQQWFYKFVRHSNQEMSVTFDDTIFWEFIHSDKTPEYGGKEHSTYFGWLRNRPAVIEEDN